MDRYNGHVCSPSCNKKYPITCWVCIGLWFLECLKDRNDVRIWLENGPLIQRSQIFFRDDSYFRFICPNCLSRRMNDELSFADRSSIISNNNTNSNITDAVTNEMQNIKMKLSQENLVLSQKMDDIKSTLESLELVYAHSAEEGAKSVTNSIQLNCSEINSSIGNKFDQIPQFFEILRNGLEEKIANVGERLSFYESIQNPTKRKRTIEMDEVLDLSMVSANENENNLLLKDGNTNYPDKTSHELLNMEVFGLEHILPSNGSFLLSNGSVMDVPKLDVFEELTHNETTQSEFELYLSKFKPTESEENIKSFILANSSVKNGSFFNVKKLIRHKAKLNNLNFVSFKISTDDKEVYNSLSDPKLWPNLTIKQFERKAVENKSKEVAKENLKKDGFQMTKTINKANKNNNNKKSKWNEKNEFNYRRNYTQLNYGINKRRGNGASNHFQQRREFPLNTSFVRQQEQMGQFQQLTANPIQHKGGYSMFANQNAFLPFQPPLPHQTPYQTPYQTQYQPPQIHVTPMSQIIPTRILEGNVYRA